MCVHVQNDYTTPFFYQDKHYSTRLVHVYVLVDKTHNIIIII